MRRTACGRWSCRAAPARAACRRSSASAPSPPTCSCARSTSTAMPSARWRRCRPRRARTLEAYARGVNAFIERSTSAFSSRACRPSSCCCATSRSHGRSADSVVTIKMMALHLSTNLNFEMMRLTFAAQGLSSGRDRGPDAARCRGRPPPLPELARALSAPAPGTPRKQAAAATVDDLIGSGRLQQLGGVGRAHQVGQAAARQRSAPAAERAVDLVSRAPGARAGRARQPLNVRRRQLAGMPLIVLGRSDTLAWGFTNTGPDVQDLFIEKINPDNPQRVPDAGRLAAVSRPTEMAIAVKGAGVRNVERRRTRHGPVLPGFYRNLDGMLGRGHRRGAAVDRAQRRRHDHRCRHVRPRRAQHRRLHRAHAPLRRADAEHGARRRHGQHRHDRAGPRAGARPRQPASLAARRCRAGMPPTTGKATSSSRTCRASIDPAGGAIGTANARIVGRDYPHLLTYDWDAAVPPAAR